MRSEPTREAVGMRAQMRVALRPAAAVDVIKSAAGVIAPWVLRVRPGATREQWVERRLPADAGVPAEARRVVGDALHGRVALTTVERSQLVVSELLDQSVPHAGEVTVR